MRRDGKNAIVAMATLGFASLLAGGCGRSDDSAVADIAAMNAALAMRETALEERLSALMPETAVDAIRNVRISEKDARQVLSGLSRDESAKLAAQAATLARFRRDASALKDEAVEAAKAENDAVCKAESCGTTFATLDADLMKGIDEFLENFAKETQETRTLLSGWRIQRLEKMENRETATFPAFAAAACECYGNWESWTENALGIQYSILNEKLPELRTVASNMTTRAADAMREHSRIVDVVTRLRAIPADAELIAAARDEALAAFNGPLREALDAMSKWSEDETNFPAEARKRADALGKRVVALDADVSSFVSLHGDYLSQQSQNKAKGATTSTRTFIDNAREATKDFADGMAALRGEGNTLAVLEVSAEEAANMIQSMSGIDEEALGAAIAKIEELRLEINLAGSPPDKGAATRRKALASRRETAKNALRDAENALSGAERDFATAKTKALADEKTAKWNAEKNRLRGNLVDIRTALDKAPRPGYKRPEWDSNALRETVGRLLGKIDSMGEDELRTAVKKAQDDFNVIEARTKWTIGTRHPTRPHIFAATEDGKDVWNADPGYGFVEPGTLNLDVVWKPGWRHPDHPHISAGQKEGTWVPDPGFKARWNGDLDPVWTIGARHPTRPHIFASKENGKDVWSCDPGYVWVQPNSHNLDCYWTSGRRHPDHEGIESAQQEGKWSLLPGWAWANPGTSDLNTRWEPGARYPGKPHIHASDTKWKWSADLGYDFVEYNSSNLSVRWVPGQLSADGNLRAGQQEGQFDRKEDCQHCERGTVYKWEPCRVCNGSGKSSYGYKCYTCDGAKWVKSGKTCANCNGRGWNWTSAQYVIVTR